jgi:ferrous iron transport protein B
MKLSELPTGEEAYIVSVGGGGAFRKRVLEMGFVKGKLVRSIKNAPLNDPIEYKILDYYVSLRREEARLIDVEAVTQVSDNMQSFDVKEEGAFELPPPPPHVIKVAFVGNPNCGKTTLFNSMSGSNEHTGNYSGVTVSATEIRFEYKEYRFEIVDLPGTYSVSAYSPEETFVRNKLLEYDPDIVLNVLDANNMTRNLYLTTQLLDMGERMVAALNMYDEFEKSNNHLDYVHLGRMIGVPMVPTVGVKGRGVAALLDKMIDVYEGKDQFVRRVRINYGLNIEEALQQIVHIIETRGEVPETVSPRYMAIKLLENDMDFVWDNFKADDVQDQINAMVAIREDLVQTLQTSDLESYLTDLRYGFIDGALNETYKGSGVENDSRSQRIDKLLTHRFWGIPIFLLFVYIMFECTFTLGEYPMDWIEAGVEVIVTFLNDILPSGAVKDLIVDGIVKGVGGVIVFLPNILILFLFITFMEDTGYMARAAFIMDKMMHKMGLHGKSFISLIMGFGCNVPAIMATRTIEDRNNRMLTMLINPFMSCSARLPVYILFCGAFFPKHAGMVLFMVYLTGVVIAIVMCRIFKQFLFASNELPFVMELPPYRIPTMRSTIQNMWGKASQYLSKMGGIIMVASIVVWFLGYYPKSEQIESSYEQQMAQLDERRDSHLIGKTEYLTASDSLSRIHSNAAQEYSFIGRIGKSIEPVIAPLGFDWKMGVSLVTGVAAKEIVVSTLAVLYNADDNSLAHNLRQEMHEGKPFFTSANVLAFMIFTLIYFPCLATLTAIKNEAGYWNEFHTSKQRRRPHKGSWRWAFFVAIYTTILAWILAWVVYHVVDYIGIL